MQANAQVAEALEGQRIIDGFFMGRVDPRPGLGAHKMQRIFIGRAGDAGVDGGVENLREWTDRGRALERGLKRDHVFGGDEDIFEYHRTAAGGALAEAAPVVDDGQTFAVARDERQLLHAVFIDYRGRDALGIDCAGGVELAPVDAIAAALSL
ncbi:hypothetical protein D3C87_1440460 [compost metagenome]